jgi:hypothetical protein
MPWLQFQGLEPRFQWPNDTGLGCISPAAARCNCLHWGHKMQRQSVAGWVDAGKSIRGWSPAGCASRDRTTSACLPFNTQPSRPVSSGRGGDDRQTSATSRLGSKFPHRRSTPLARVETPSPEVLSSDRAVPVQRLSLGVTVALCPCLALPGPAYPCKALLRRMLCRELERLPALGVGNGRRIFTATCPPGG